MNWVEVVDRITPLVFRIYAGNSAGTGFLVSVKQTGPDGINHAIVATAWHVIEEAASKQIDVKLVSADRTRVFDTQEDSMRVQQLGSTVHDTN